ncbi:MAG: hypothetical protein NVV66_18020 [Cellulomonas sp.]|uniref:hypothetical protein n=1 Tax=Cellulomonas sp. TaxID=40001 RepID=UPI00258CD533|nr:hypothetical protein [Cellulomonas sp.]MCR6706495.1 hypothetical protein [Cellulomonas sp.]
MVVDPVVVEPGTLGHLARAAVRTSPAAARKATSMSSVTRRASIVKAMAVPPTM